MKTTTLIKEIGKALSTPADSYADIAERICTATALTVTDKQVNQALVVLRKAQPGVWGWTVPHCKRGPSWPGRLRRVAINSSPTTWPQTTLAATQDGAYGTVLNAKVQLHNLAQTLLYHVPHVPAATGREFTRFARSLEYMSQEAGDIAVSLTA